MGAGCATGYWSVAFVRFSIFYYFDSSRTIENFVKQARAQRVCARRHEKCFSKKKRGSTFLNFWKHNDRRRVISQEYKITPG